MTYTSLVNQIIIKTLSTVITIFYPISRGIKNLSGQTVNGLVGYILSALYVNSLVLLFKVDKLYSFFFISFSSQLTADVRLATFFCKYGNCPFSLIPKTLYCSYLISWNI